ncbi:hypothetical protein RE428_48930 (plasmid) [Marinobacter nanhaiticus D15-8W]|nr:lytic transglycosylase domain-containing protein [Marinobacter nanhaiticus]BES73875.1 hypothetical protein RE428_48930 [Marinobacter nanhaiticus D15-8W]
MSFLKRTFSGAALLVAFNVAPALADDLSDERLLYADLFGGKTGATTSTAPESGERWISFESDDRQAWSAEQVNAMREAFKPKPEKAKQPAAQDQGASRPYAALVERYAREAGLDVELVHRVIQQESGYDPTAISSKGAKGLMQLMDSLSQRWNINPFDPESNIKVGTRYLADLLSRFGSVELALAAYNAGPGTVEEYGGIPPYPETENYVSTITASLGAPAGQ